MCHLRKKLLERSISAVFLKVFYSKRVVTILIVYYYMQVFPTTLVTAFFHGRGACNRDDVFGMEITTYFRCFFSSILNSPMTVVFQERL